MVIVSGLQSSAFELLPRGAGTQGRSQYPGMEPSKQPVQVGGARERLSCAENDLAKNMIYKCLAYALFDEALHFSEHQRWAAGLI